MYKNISSFSKAMLKEFSVFSAVMRLGRDEIILSIKEVDFIEIKHILKIK